MNGSGLHLKSYNKESALDHDNLNVPEKSGLAIPSGIAGTIFFIATQCVHAAKTDLETSISKLHKL